MEADCIPPFSLGVDGERGPASSRLSGGPALTGLCARQLGAVVVVLEGAAMPSVTADWADGEPTPYPVTMLDESLAPYFA